MQLNALALDSARAPIPGRLFQWSSSDDAVARVSTTGLVTAVADGEAVITATTANVSAGAAITVEQLAVDVAFAPMPSPARAEEVLPSIRVELRDRRGHRVVNAVGTVELSLETGPADAILSGTRRADVADGVAEFSDLQIDTPGLDYTVQATTDGLVGTSDPFTVTLRFTSISAAGPFTCAGTHTGRAYCWGRNSLFGHLGDGSTEDRLTPTPVAGDHRFESLVTGRVACGIEGSALYCWGNNGPGTYGDGTTESSAVPVPAGGGLPYRQVSTFVTARHTCGVAVDGSAFCWGFNEQYELGDGTQEQRLSPVLTGGGHHFTAIAIGASHSCAINIASDAYCWGSHWVAEGVIGDGQTEDRPFPTLVTGGHKFASIHAGASHTCALTTTGDAYCWGLNQGGSLAVGSSAENQLAPALVVGNLTYRELSVSENGTCGITLDGRAFCWGFLHRVGAANNLATGPTAVAESFRFVSLSNSSGNTCGVTPEGDAYCWGYGVLGNGTTTPSTEPVRVLPEGVR